MRSSVWWRATPRDVVFADVTRAWIDNSGAKQALLAQHLLGDAQRVDRRREAAIGDAVREQLADLLGGAAVVDRSGEVNAQLVRPVQRAQHAQRDQAALATRQGATRPEAGVRELFAEPADRRIEVVGG